MRSHLGVSEQHDACNLVTDAGIKIADGSRGKGGSLAVRVSGLIPYHLEGCGESVPVTAGNNGCTRAAAVRKLEKPRHLLDGSTARAVREGIVPKACRVATTNTLNPDVATAEPTL